MFGISLVKILFTLAVVAGVWLAFRWVKRTRTLRARETAARRRVGERGQGAGQPRKTDDAESFVACRVCGTYVASHGANSCGREDCPYGAGRQP